MKQWMLILVCSSMLFLVACQNENESTDETTSNTDGNTVETEPNLDVETNEDYEELTNEEDTEEQDTRVEPVTEEDIEVQYRSNEKNWAIEPIEDGIEENVLLLTIDDAPDKYALEMAQLLKELNVPAIFFVNGHFLQNEEDYETLRNIHELGFHIGNHTMTHPVLSDINEERQKEEIIELNVLVEKIIGEKPKFFRAPHGANTDYVKDLVKQEGMLLMNWTYGYDYFEPYMDAEKLKEAMISGEGPEVDVNYSLLQPGANLLMHDREWTFEALEDIVKGLRDKGYTFVNPEAIEIPES
ncbi:peptidoglycan/xylan/chitin deacetylase (PgdA/CDA1 family) [Gracilibacillus halotolerans]|uniref:Peptidoglycan/xylan/chitin deacetylase (PgdA/CDA1 family) n=1 Tax=Gracilibacillus halotolerans TaxID=74386 RepID=A0A841RFF5_9BACI|nr:polysaccharide deacetylase family protein [Gracilibacillus halotolerans]MBB6511311.1 peptidoglycan/xylan/chitin deacetylase (PgdA/CDA1 family) [Gracilibacillus halotolerans]